MAPLRAPRRALVFLALAVLALQAPLPVPATAEGEVPCSTVLGLLCPDLVTDTRKLNGWFLQTQTFSSSQCAVVEGMVTAGTHRLLKFTFTTPNNGPGDLVIGRPADHPEWFVFSNCHNHYHFRQYADYRLWTLDGYPQWLAARAANPTQTAEEVLAGNPQLASEFLAGNKAGFCVIDIVPTLVVVGLPPPRYGSCGSNQGISVGWADEYYYGLDGQWIVVDGITPGTYVLEAEVNAERLYTETTYLNNAAAVRVNII